MLHNSLFLLKVKSYASFPQTSSLHNAGEADSSSLWRWTFTLVCDMVTTNSAAIPRTFVLEGEGALLKEMHWKPILLKRVQEPKWQKKTNCLAFYSWKKEENTSRGGQDRAQLGSVWERQWGTIHGGRVSRGLLKTKMFNTQLKLFVLL